MTPDATSQQSVGRCHAKAGLRVAMVTPGWPLAQFTNGIVSYTSQMRDGLEQQDSRVHLLTNQVGPGEHPGVIKLEHGENDSHMLRRFVYKACRRVSGEGLKRKASALAICREIDKLYRKEGLDVVELPETFGLAKWIAPRSPVPVVVKLHGPWFLVGPAYGMPEDDEFKQRVIDEAAGVRAAYGVMSPSRFVLCAMEKHLGAPLGLSAVVPNPCQISDGVPQWSLTGVRPGELLFVGRMDRCKGADLVVQAFCEVAKRHPDSLLRLVGPDAGIRCDDGQTLGINAYLDKYVPDDAIRSRIEVCGAKNHQELLEYRLRAAVTIVASRFENFPNTVLEAQALGCPVVASAVGGTVELVRDGYNGYLFESGDAYDLASTLSACLTDMPRAQGLGRQAAEDIATNCSMRKIALDTIGFYERVMNSACNC